MISPRDALGSKHYQYYTNKRRISSNDPSTPGDLLRHWCCALRFLILVCTKASAYVLNVQGHTEAGASGPRWS